MPKILFTADWHIRGEAPRCRVDDDWLASQAYDIQSVMDVARENQVDMIAIVGDLFHQARAATEAVNMLLTELAEAPCPVYILAGNHDLPYHAYEQLERSSIGTVLKQYGELSLNKAMQLYPTIAQWDAYPFGKDEPGTAPIRFVHRLVFPTADARPIEDCGQTAEEIGAEFQDNRVIICGDYHHQFDVALPSGQRVLNPGCLNVQVADMVDYQPMVGILSGPPDFSEVGVEWVALRKNPMAKIDVDYLEHERVREARTEHLLAAVEKFSQDSGEGELTQPFSEELMAAVIATKDEAAKAVIVEVLQEVGNESK